MAEGFKTRRGGSKPTQPFALIQQPYPVGSTCTCSKGDIVLTAPDTSGLALFAIPEAGTWTVTSTDGTDSKAQTVEVSTQGETIVAPALAYELVLYDAGNEYSSITGGWAVTNSGVSSATKNATSIYLNNDDNWNCYTYSGKAVNMADYTTIHVKVSNAWRTNSNGYMYIDVGGQSAYMTSKSTGARTYTLDISKITSGAVKVGTIGYWSDDAGQKSSFGIEITKIWLS